MSERARSMLDTPEKRLAYIVRCRRRLEILERREAPVEERASLRARIECVEHGHAVLAVLQREVMVLN